MITDNHTEFLNAKIGVIGRCVSTRNEPNTSSQFYFWMADKDKIAGSIEIGNIIAAYADGGNEVTFGIVTEMRAYSNMDSFIADYLSHDFGDAEKQTPTDISEIVVVTCAVMRNWSGKSRPIERSRAYFPSETGIQFAYGIVNKESEIIFSGAPIPLGVFQNGDGTVCPIWVDDDFLTGPEGAHLNVSGISGLASKTSFIQFAIKSLLTHSRKKVAAVMFNVKSRDLLFIDRSNPKCSEDSTSKAIYESIGIQMKPFSNSCIFAPQDPRTQNGTQSQRVTDVTPFSWNLQAIRRDIPNLFDAQDWDDKMQGVWYAIEEAIEKEDSQILTYTHLIKWVGDKIDRTKSEWVDAGGHKATWKKMLARLRSFPKSYRGLISTTADGKDIPWNTLKKGGVFVIDIQMLNDNGKRLVFGRAIRQLSRMLESQNGEVDAIAVFVDELNKFAPAGNIRSPLKQRLIDITARGRSIGLALFGAEQFASSVDKEITENCSTFCFGRTETTELQSPNYRHLSNELKAKLTMLDQGQLLVKFAKFSQPIFVRFPHPPCLPGDQYKDGENKLQSSNGKG